MSEKLAPSERHVYLHEGRKVYEWDQTLSEVNLYIDTPPGVRAKDLFCDVEKQHVKFGIKGNPPFLDVSSQDACQLQASVTSLTIRARLKCQCALEKPLCHACSSTWLVPSRYQTAFGP
jgi:hypothetical protein